MDFSLDESQQAVADLADQILESRVTPEGIKEIEDAGSWYDRDTYAELAKAGLCGIGLGEDVGGGGMGILEVAQVMEAMGRHVAPLPLWSCALAAMAIDRFGSDEQRQRELPGAADGSRLLTTGIQEWHNDDYLSPGMQATSTGASSPENSWRLDGTKIVVEFAEESQKILVTARADEGAGLFLASLDDEGITKEPGTSIRLQPVHEIAFNDVSAELVGEISQPSSDSSVVWLARAATALLCATQVGVLDKALKMTAEYTSTREQFGRPIATFQAVTQRLANQFMHVNGAKLTTASALYLLSTTEGKGAARGEDALEEIDEDIDKALHVAKWYASHCAHEVAHATQHVHGGMGVDRDYPLHRYTLWNKHIETSLGAGTQQLRRLGEIFAAS